MTVLFAVVSFPTVSAKISAVTVCCTLTGLIWQVNRDRQRSMLSTGMMCWLAAGMVAMVILITVLAASADGETPNVGANAADAPSQAPPSRETNRESPTSTVTPSNVPTSPPEQDQSESPRDPEFVVMHGPDAPLNIPRAEDSALTLVDLDELVVEPNVFDEMGSDVDMVHDSVGDLWRANETDVGFGPETQPEPEECKKQAQSRAIGALDAGDATTAKETAFCVVTTEGNIAWMLLTEKRGSVFPDLVFEVTVWTSHA